MKLCTFTADIFFLDHVSEDNKTTEKENKNLNYAKVWLIVHCVVYA